MCLVTYEHALAHGLKRYFTGIACKHGHFSERFVINKGCVACDLIRVMRERNADRIAYNEYQRAYGSANKDKMSLYNRRWQQKHPKERNALEATRQASKIKRTPKWADLKKIREFYKRCPDGYTVDHIVPLRGKTVSGLHVEYNLQYLTGSENASKGNRYAT